MSITARGRHDKWVLHVSCVHRGETCECRRRALAELLAVEAQAGHRPPALPPSYRELLGVACAWLCVAVSAVILGAALARWAWVVIGG